MVEETQGGGVGIDAVVVHQRSHESFVEQVVGNYLVATLEVGLHAGEDALVSHLCNLHTSLIGCIDGIALMLCGSGESLHEVGHVGGVYLQLLHQIGDESVGGSLTGSIAQRVVEGGEHHGLFGRCLYYLLGLGFFLLVFLLACSSGAERSAEHHGCSKQNNLFHLFNVECLEFSEKAYHNLLPIHYYLFTKLFT